MRDKVLGRGRNLLVTETTENLGHNLVERLLVVRLKLVLVLLLELFLVEVEVNGNLLVLLKLHDNEGVASLTLAQRWIETNDKHVVDLVGLGKHHELLDGLVLDLVVVRLSTEAERCLIHIDVKTTSAKDTLAKARRGAAVLSHTWE